MNHVKMRNCRKRFKKWSADSREREKKTVSEARNGGDITHLVRCTTRKKGRIRSQRGWDDEMARQSAVGKTKKSPKFNLRHMELHEEDEDE